MYVEHLRKNFYDIIVGQRVMILASYDVDSVAACKIMEYLFMVDDLPHSIHAVEGLKELKETFLEHQQSARYVLLINVGGTVDIMELFGNPPNVTFFVLDSHRPTHILNIYNESNQVRILTPPTEEEGIPSFDEIFRDELSDSDESEQEDNTDPSETEEEDAETEETRDGRPVTGRKRKRTRIGRHMERLEKAKERRSWEDTRRRILFEYTQHSFYGVPASLIALETAWTMSRANNDIVWCTIVGVTEFFVLRRIERARYTMMVTELNSHVQRIEHAHANVLSSLKITFDNDLSLFLYRRWSIWESIKSTPTWVCKMNLWSQKGEQKLKQYMCEVGLPLREVKQVFIGMAIDLKEDIKNILNKRAAKFGLAEDITFGTFFAQYGFGFKVSALDSYLGTLAILEQPHPKPTTHRFLKALHALNKDRVEINQGTDLARLMITTMNRQVQAFLEMQQFNVMSTVIYVIAQEGGIETDWFRKPGCLVLLAQFALRAFVEFSPRKSVRQLPLLLLAPQQKDYHMAIGIPPVSSHISHNLFGKVFEQISVRMPETVRMDSFDTSVCQVTSTHTEQFLELLISLLTN